ncbi:MAG TPA: hypothetical protein VGF14_07385 [Alphaproteobacteria bacterium]
MDVAIVSSLVKMSKGRRAKRLATLRQSRPQAGREKMGGRGPLSEGEEALGRFLKSTGKPGVKSIIGYYSYIVKGHFYVWLIFCFSHKKSRIPQGQSGI